MTDPITHNADKLDTSLAFADDLREYGQTHWETYGYDLTEVELEEVKAIIGRHPRFSPVNDLEYALAFVIRGQKLGYAEGMGE